MVWCHASLTEYHWCSTPVTRLGKGVRVSRTPALSSVLGKKLSSGTPATCKYVENYLKGKNVTEPLDRDKLPIPNLPPDFLWMQVKGGSKMRNLLELALKEYGNGKDVLWTGSGASVCKAISCAEILKRKFKNVHQFNKIQYSRCEEYWEPKLEGFDQIVVNRDVPMIHILLSHEPINAGLPGYQGPKKNAEPSGSGQQNRPKRLTKPNISPQVEKAGLGYNIGKSKKNVPKKEKS